jgi:DNA-binding transcriptional regulator GbsR (MarR family)
MGYGTGKLGVETDAEVIETVGRLIEFWGFKRALGRVWALLYLAPEPLSAASIGEALSMSAGAVSTALSELQLWGVVGRAHKPADRKEYFSAEEDIWKMITRVLSDRELREVENACETFTRAEQTLREQNRERRGKSGSKELEFRAARVAHLRTAALTGKTLLEGLILTSKLDASPLRMLAKWRKNK